MNPQPRRQLFLLFFTILAVFAISCSKRVSPAPKPQTPPFEYLQTWGHRGDGPGQLAAPVAFAVDALDRVYFADSGSNYVHKFEATGVPLLSFEVFQAKHAAGIAADSGGAIYVADAMHGDMFIFFPDGTLLRTQHFAPQPHFTGVLGIAIDDTGNLYVPDAAHSRVTKFDDRGHLARSWSVPHAPASAGELPSFIATSPD